jgi:hypothetical protein
MMVCSASFRYYNLPEKYIKTHNKHARGGAPLLFLALDTINIMEAFTAFE